MKIILTSFLFFLLTSNCYADSAEHLFSESVIAANRAFQNGDFNTACSLMKSASEIANVAYNGQFVGEANANKNKACERSNGSKKAANPGVLGPQEGEVDPLKVKLEPVDVELKF